MGRKRWRLSAETVRAHVPDVNDGTLAVAGLAEGLALVAEVRSLALVVLLAAVAGAMSVAGVKFSAVAAEREVQRDLVREEQRLLELNPDEELAELTEHFMAKGVTAETAAKVAHELNNADALTAQLETEYGIHELVAAGRPFTEALASGLSFMLGAVVPVLLAFFVPRRWVDEYILLGVAASLTVTAIVLSRLGHTHVFSTIVRSLFIGAAAMGASIVIASIFSST